MNNYYLIDYENVHEAGLEGCEQLGKNNTVVIFTTDQAKNFDLRVIDGFGEARVKFKTVPQGKQSADMHIGSYMGYLIGKDEKDCKIVIVSNDTDFDKVIEFWRAELGIDASRRSQIVLKEEQPVKNAKKRTAEKKGQKQQVENQKGQKQKVEKKQAVAKKSTAQVDEDMQAKLILDVKQAAKNAKIASGMANNTAKIAAGLYGEKQFSLKVRDALEKKYESYLDLYKAIEPVLDRYAKGKQAGRSKQEKQDKQAKQPKQVKQPKQDKKTVNSEIQKTLSKAGFPDEVIAFVASTSVKNLGKEQGKQKTNNALVDRFGQDKGSEIYKHIKKLI